MCPLQVLKVKGFILRLLFFLSFIASIFYFEDNREKRFVLFIRSRIWSFSLISDLSIYFYVIASADFNPSQLSSYLNFLVGWCFHLSIYFSPLSFFFYCIKMILKKKIKSLICICFRFCVKPRVFINLGIVFFRIIRPIITARIGTLPHMSFCHLWNVGVT